MRVRLIAYNILSGGEGRADPLAEVLLGQRPDVVGLHEAVDLAVLRRLASRLAMDFVAAPSRGGTVALLSRFRIVESTNVAVLLDSTMPLLDVTLDVDGRPLTVRVAHLTQRDEATRTAVALVNRVPDAMLVSYDPPMGVRVVDGTVGPSDAPVPPNATSPARQLDQVLVRPDLPVAEAWAEHDRLAYYASDHLPGGAEIEFSVAGAGAA